MSNQKNSNLESLESSISKKLKITIDGYLKLLIKEIK